MTVDFREIYDTDLVYVPDCWKLCGDAHCCSFHRYKARFKLIGGKAEQELPLLPGEYEFLRDQNWLEQFQDYDHRVVDYAFGERSIRIESIVSRRPGCSCDHATRTTICRLYPLLPVFDLDGRIVAAERLGMYDTLEQLEGLDRACKVTDMPFSEIGKFFTISSAIARDPLALFYISAYRLANEYLRGRLKELGEGKNASYFSIFEGSLLRNQLIDHDSLGADLSALAGAFERKYGRAFAVP